MFERRQELYVHMVWSTWDRTPLMDSAMQGWLWPALGEQARSLGCTWAVAGGTTDHVHLLCAVPTTLAVADLVRHVKGWTARAANATKPDSLRWQGGYGAFSVSSTDLPAVEAYVRNQEAHHGANELRDDWE